MNWSIAILRAAAFIGSISVGLLAPWGAQARPGAVDRSFGARGEVRLPVGRYSLADFVRVQDGKLVASGIYHAPGVGDREFVARFKRDGSLDASFGTDGLVHDGAGMPLVLRGGRIVTGASRRPENRDLVTDLRWLDKDGKPLTSFGGGGGARLAVPGRSIGLRELAEDSEGRILAALAAWGNPDMILLARFTPSGSLDQTFGEGGLVWDQIPPAAEPASLAVTPDGGFVVAAETAEMLPHPAGIIPVHRVHLIKYHENGRRDRRFGTAGAVATGLVGPVTDVLVDQRGRLVLGAAEEPDLFEFRSVVARFGSDGDLDTSFGSKGLVRLRIGEGLRPSALLLQPDGKIVAGGGFVREIHNPALGGGWSIYRLTEAGRLDKTFATEGVGTSKVGSNFRGGSDMVQMPDGGFVVTGNSPHCQYETFTLVGFQGDDPPVAASQGAGPHVEPCPGDLPLTSDTVTVTVDCPVVERWCEGEVAIEVPAPEGATKSIGRRRFGTGWATSKRLRIKLSDPAIQQLATAPELNARLVVRAKSGKRKRTTETAVRILRQP